MKENSSSKVYIYVIDNDYNILYMNDNYRKHFKVNENTMKCYDAYMKLENPCEHCIVQKLKQHKGQNDRVQLTGYNQSFHCLMSYMAFNVKWENKEDAIMVVFNQENELNKYLYYNESLENVYDELFELDITNNEYRIIFHEKGKYQIPAMEGKLDALITEIAENMIYPDDKKRFLTFWDLNSIRNKLKDQPMISSDFRKRLINGKYIWASLSVVKLLLASEEDEKLLCFVQDVDAKRSQEIKLKAQENINGLTGLYRGSAFYQLAEQMLMKHTKKDYVILYLDIEHFKLYNDWYGHEKGDELLKEMATRLKQIANSCEGISGYFGGDDFVLLLPVDKIDIAYFEKEAISWIGELGVSSGFLPSIGVYYIDRDENVSISLMCDRAAIAANSAKGNYSTRVAYYEGAMKRKLEIEHEILLDVKRGIDHEEFQIYLQPKCNMKNGKIVNFEALVRWYHPTKGIVYPGDFIPVLENNGFILKLDMYIWEKTCELLRSWITAGYKAIPISVNISRIDIFQIDIVDTMRKLISRYDIDVSLLNLEITESAYAKDMDKLLVIVQKLRKLGFTVLMDDFGSGYSSLNMLKDIEIDTLKIDMRFLYLEANSDNKGTGIIESVINLANWMNLSVVAEGVETEEQVKYLSSIGCQFAQGYYYYKPEPAAYFEKYIKEGTQIDYNGITVKEFENIQIKDLLHNDISSESLLRNILGGIVLYDYYQGEIKLIKVNDYYQQILERNGLDLKTVDFKGLLKDDYLRFVDMFEKAQSMYSQGEEGIFRYTINDSKIMWVQVKVFYFRMENGHKHFYGTVRDISEMHHLQQERDAFINSSRDCIVKFLVKDSLEKAIMIHKGIDDQYDYPYHHPKSEYTEKKIEKYVHPEDQNRLKQFYRNAKNWKPNEVFEYRAITKTNEIVWIEQEINYAYEEDGYKIYFCITRNITEFKRIKEALVDSQNIISETIGMSEDNPLNNLNNKNLKMASKHISDIVRGGVMGGYCEDEFPIYFASQNIIEYLGYESYDDLVQTIDGKIDNTIYHEDREKVMADIGDHYYEGLTYSTKYRMLKKDGSMFWVFDQGCVVQAENGKLAIVSVIHDISELMELEEKLNYFVNVLANDIIEVDIYEDHYEMRLLEHGLANHLYINEKDYLQFLKDNLDILFSSEQLRKEMRNKDCANKRRFSLSLSKANEKDRLIELSLSLVKREEDKVTYLGLTTDITDDKDKDDNWEMTKRYFSQMSHIAGLEIWELDPETMTLQYFQQQNNYIANSLGFFSNIPDFFNTFEKKGLIHPESIEDMKQFIKHLKEGYDNLICQVHFLTPNNIDIWVEINAGAYSDENGKVVKILGSTRDITKEKQEDFKNKQIAKFLENIEKQSKYSCRVNLSKDSVLSNKSNVQLAYDKQTYSSYIHTLSERVVHPDYKEKLLYFMNRDRILHEYKTNFISSDSFEYLRLVNNEYLWVKVIYSILLMDKSDDVYAYTYVLDVHDEKQRELELLRKAQLDSLTGLLNRSTAKSIIDQKLMKDNKMKGALLILDLDNFKKVNDCFGHVSGDQILIENAIKLKKQFRKDDIVCRLGGDEFIVMCSYINEVDIIKKAQQLCEVMRKQYQNGEESFETSVSIGIAMIPEHGSDFDTLYHKADMALYKSKQHGKKSYNIYKDSYENN